MIGFDLTQEQQDLRDSVHEFSSDVIRRRHRQSRSEGVRLLIWKAAWTANPGAPFARAASMAKLEAGDVAMRVTKDAIQILGGYGYIRDFPVEK